MDGQIEKKVIQERLAKVEGSGKKLSGLELWSLLDCPDEIPVKECASSNVAAYGYHEESGTLKVIFANGTEYRYLAVKKNHFENLEKSDSKGREIAFIKQVFAGIKW